jgi:predicted ATPase/DNA-binding SARP family transcriptional activator
VIEIRLLGPVQVQAGAARLTIGGPRPTSLLVALALTPGDVVSTDRLLEEVWGAAPPRSAVDTLQSYLSRLRHALEPTLVAHRPGRVLVRETGGYRLDAELVATDARGFVAEVAAARRALGRGETRAGVDQLARALGRWHGTVAQGIDLGPVGRAEAARLHELRLGATEELLGARLARAEHAQVVEELEALVRAHPVRERLHGLRMLALYRSERQGEALAAYREARRQLVDHLGVEPSPPLVRLHDRLLAQDPALLIGAPQTDGHGAVAGTDAPVVVSVLGPSNLPAPPVELVGRTSARGEVADALRRVRLVTLTGAGGCGKTQLGLAVARDIRREHPDGVWFVDLQSLRDDELVPETVAETLGVDVGAGQETVTDALVRHLEDRRALVVLDNCEHLVDACAALVHVLLVRCARLRVLATSRQPLDVEGEVTWRVPSLQVPGVDADLVELRRSDAAQLFEQRAAAVRPGYRITDQDVVSVRTLCRDLDGIPLALELAAARLRILAPEEVAEELDDRLALLRSSRRGTPSRHRTLEAAIAWSYDLLDDPSRRLIERLSAFEGGATLDAVEAVCAGPGLEVATVLGSLESLVERSLVEAAPSPVGPVRHRLLESIRSFVRARLTEGESAALSARHATWCAEHATVGASRLTGEDQLRWLNAFHAEQGNVRAALAWSLANDRAGLALRIVVGVWWFWLQFGHAREGARWLAAVLDAVDQAPDELLQRAHVAAGRLHGALGDHATAMEHLRHGVDLARASGDAGRTVLSLARLAQVLDAAGEFGDAEATLGRAREVAVAVGDPWVRASLEDAAGHLAWRAGDLPGAEASFRRSEVAYLEAGDRWSACLARLGSATVARRHGDGLAALELHERNLTALRSLTRSELDFVGLAPDLRGIAVVCSTAGRHEDALFLVGASEPLHGMGELPLAPEERREVELILTRAAAGLTPTQLASAQARGRASSAPAALDRAFEVATSLRADVSR